MRYIVMSASAAILAAAGLFAWIERYPAIAPIEPPAASAFDSTLIDKGRGLVALGDCAVCHTRPGGGVFAGGLKLPTPFGVIYSTNITPDPKTGIGRWSEAAFTRAMHDGIDRGGNYLYPAFPYDHFTKVTNEDIKAIYAYLMTRTPVTFSAPKNELIFPIRYRFVVAGWNLSIPSPRCLHTRSFQRYEVESRRLSGRRFGPLWGMPYATKFCRSGEAQPALRRRRGGRLARTGAKRRISCAATVVI